jgi:hypothetical protein
MKKVSNWHEFRLGWAVKYSDFANNDLFRMQQSQYQMEVGGKRYKVCDIEKALSGLESID